MTSDISVAIIVKNEEAVIERCLDSVSKFADEVIVVDTGSTDKTMELARKHTPHVYASERFKQDTPADEFQFGVAKNEAIRRCTKRWVIWWDADDVADDESAALIREIAQGEDALVSFLLVGSDCQFEHKRMFPRGKGVWFDESHACHEYLVNNGLPLVKRLDVKVRHKPLKGGGASCRRNRRLLEKDYCERGKKDQRTLFYLADAYKGCGQFKKALTFYKKYLEVSKWHEERAMAYLYRGRCFFKLKRWRKACREALSSMVEDSRFAEPLCLLGDCHFEMGYFKMAMHWYEMAQEMSVPQDAVLFVERSRYNSYPKDKAARCREKLGIESIELSGKEANKILQEVQGRRQQDVAGPARDIVVRSPDTLSDAAMATAALTVYLTRHPGSDIKVCDVGDYAALYEGIFGVETTTDFCEGAIEFQCPDDMRDKHKVEWFSRCLGVMSDDCPVPNIVLSKEEGMMQTPSGCVVVQTCSDIFQSSRGVDFWREVVLHLQEYGKTVVQVDDGCEPLPHVTEFLDNRQLGRVKAFVAASSLVVGSAGWCTQMAAAFGKPSVVLWEGSSPAFEGYNVQTNVMDDGKDTTLTALLNEVDRVASKCKIGAV